MNRKRTSRMTGSATASGIHSAEGRTLPVAASSATTAGPLNSRRLQSCKEWRIRQSARRQRSLLRSFARGRASIASSKLEVDEGYRLALANDEDQIDETGHHSPSQNRSRQ